MASITVHCPRCNSDHLYRHGKTPAGHVRYRCPVCLHVFQLTYTYEARKPGVKDKILDMVFNCAVILDGLGETGSDQEHFNFISTYHS